MRSSSLCLSVAFVHLTSCPVGSWLLLHFFSFATPFHWHGTARHSKREPPSRFSIEEFSSFIWSSFNGPLAKCLDETSFCFRKIISSNFYAKFLILTNSNRLLFYSCRGHFVKFYSLFSSRADEPSCILFCLRGNCRNKYSRKLINLINAKINSSNAHILSMLSSCSTLVQNKNKIRK